MNNLMSYLKLNGYTSGIDLKFYLETNKKLRKSESFEYFSNIHEAKVFRVIDLSKAMESKQPIKLTPIKFNTQCCNARVNFNFNLWVYECPKCRSSVKAHSDFMPMGELANRKLGKLRQQLHKELDDVWVNGFRTRNQTYSLLSEKLNWPRELVHIANVTTDEDVANYYQAIVWLKSEIRCS